MVIALAMEGTVTPADMEEEVVVLEVMQAIPLEIMEAGGVEAMQVVAPEITEAGEGDPMEDFLAVVTAVTQVEITGAGEVEAMEALLLEVMEAIAGEIMAAAGAEAVEAEEAEALVVAVVVEVVVTPTIEVCYSPCLFLLVFLVYRFKIPYSLKKIRLRPCLSADLLAFANGVILDHLGSWLSY